MVCFQAQIYCFTNLRQTGKGRRMELERSGFKLPTLLLAGYICYSKQGSKQGSYAFLNCCIISTILYQFQVNNIVTSSIKSYYKIMIIILYAMQCIFTTYLFYRVVCIFRDFPSGSDGKASAYNAGDLGSMPGWKDPLEKAMAPHSRTLAQKIPRTEETGRLESTGSRRVRHDLATSLSLTFASWKKEMAMPGKSHGQRSLASYSS